MLNYEAFCVCKYVFFVCLVVCHCCFVFTICLSAYLSRCKCLVACCFLNLVFNRAARMADVEAVANKLGDVSIVTNGDKADTYWGFSLHETYKMAITFYRG